MFKRKKNNGKVIGATLVEGLPVKEDSDLVVKLTDEALTLIVVSPKQEFEINISKLTLIDTKDEVEMQQIIKQSAPGMIIGAATFGLLGAMVGGRVKTEEKKLDESMRRKIQGHSGKGIGEIVYTHLDFEILRKELNSL